MKSNKNKIKKGFKFKSIFISLILSFIISLTFYNFYTLYKDGGVKLTNYKDNNEEVNFHVSKGTSLKKIASDLKDKGIIYNKFLFTLKCKRLGISSKFQYGDFIIPKNITFDEIIKILKTPNENVNQIKFLIKEGETQDEIARNLESKGILKYEDFINACNNLNFDYEFLKGIPKRESMLEGYLYPDTYFIEKTEPVEVIIHKFLKRFNEVYINEVKNEIQNSNFSLDQIITIASIIEREIKYEPEKSIAASVIFNRLKKGIKLQLDATVIYANKNHKERTTIEDTKVKSDYNTYYVEGLPIGPISNPSLNSIKAVLNPAQTNYIYYVLKDEKTGEHFYTESYDEFLNAKKKYLKRFNN